MMMDAGLDTGDMLLKKTTPISPEDDASSLHDRLSLLGAETMAETLDLLKAGKLAPVKQDDALTCYAPMMKKDTGAIDWNSGAETILNLIRGVTPWPGAFTTLDGKTLKIHKARRGSAEGRPGEVISAGKNGLEAAAADGSVIIEELQLEGKKRLKASEFLAGYRVEPGTLLG
jgi:methionyl-tRNA formyltransferase